MVRRVHVSATVSLVTALVVVLSAALIAGDKPPVRVKIFCLNVTDPSGFVDQKSQALVDSVNDVKQAISKKKDWLELVTRREDAHIVVEVVERFEEPSGEVETTTESQTDKSGKTTRGTIKSRVKYDYVVKAVMTYGDYRNDLVGRCPDDYLFGGSWKTAASRVAGALEDWVKKNYSRLDLQRS